MNRPFGWTVTVVLLVCGVLGGCGKSASIARPPELAPAPLPVPPPSQLGARLETTTQTLRSAALRRAHIDTVPMVLKDTTLAFSLSPRDAGRAVDFFAGLPIEVPETRVVDRIERPAGFVLKQFDRVNPLRLACADLRPFTAAIPVIGGVVKTSCYARSDAVIRKVSTTVVTYPKQAVHTLVERLPSSNVVDVSLAANARLESVELEMDGDRVTASASASLAARVSGGLPFGKVGTVSCGFGEMRPEARVAFSARIGLDATGDLVIRDKTPRLEWVRSCNITAADINFVSLLQTLGLYRNVEAALDGMLEKVTTRVVLQDRYAAIWDTLQVPHAAGAGSLLRDSLWLLLQPQGVQLQSIEGREGKIVSGVQLTARPRLIVGPRPQADTARFPGISVGSAPGDFRLRVAVQVERAAAVRQLTAAMRTSSFSTPLGALRVDSVDIYPSGGATVLALNVKSPFKAWVYLTGTLAVLSDSAAALALSNAIPTPSIIQAAGAAIGVDSTTSYRVIFDDLQFTTETQNALLNVADWVAHDPIRRLIQQRAQVPLSPYLARALSRLPSNPVPLGRVAEATLTIAGVRPVGVHIDHTMITALLDAAGSATVRLVGVP